LKEVGVLFAKASELFIEYVMLKSWFCKQNRIDKTLMKSDIAFALSQIEEYDFLVDELLPQYSNSTKLGNGNEALNLGKWKLLKRTNFIRHRISLDEGQAMPEQSNLINDKNTNVNTIGNTPQLVNTVENKPDGSSLEDYQFPNGEDCSAESYIEFSLGKEFCLQTKLLNFNVNGSFAIGNIIGKVTSGYTDPAPGNGSERILFFKFLASSPIGTELEGEGSATLVDFNMTLRLLYFVNAELFMEYEYHCSCLEKTKVSGQA